MTEPRVRVSRERWKRAQEWELHVWREASGSRAKTWLRKTLFRSPDEGDDWNYWWAEKFDNYDAIRTPISNAIELGCGPFTNIRHLLRGRDVGHVVCSDPLARDYIKLRGAWLAESHRRGEIVVDDHPIEECPFASDFFDVVVLVNVLDHVMDAIAGLGEAIRIAAPGGYLVLGQDLTSDEDVEAVGEDIGHPLRLTHELLDRELLPHFEPVLHRVLPRDAGRNPHAHYGTYLFIGQKVSESCRCPQNGSEAQEHRQLSR